MSHAASPLNTAHVAQTSIAEVLCRHFKALDAGSLVDNFGRCQQDLIVRILGAVDAEVLANKAGFAALEAILEQEVPATAVLTEKDGNELQAGPARRSGTRSLGSDGPDILDAAACISQLAHGRPLVVPNAERVNPGVRDLAVDLVFASTSDVSTVMLALPPNGRLWLPDKLTLADFALVGIAEGAARVQVTGSGRRSNSEATKPFLSSPYGLLSRTDLGCVPAGHWIAVPKADLWSLQIQAGERGVAVLIILIRTPTWHQLMQFAMQVSCVAANRPADLAANATTTIPTAEELIGMKQAYLRNRWAWAAAPRAGRVSDVMAVVALSDDDWLQVRPERRYTSRMRQPYAHPRLPVQSVGEASINESAIVYECGGAHWDAPIACRSWIEQVLGLEGSFRGSDLPLVGKVDAVMRLALLKHMLSIGLLVVRPAASHPIRKEQ